MVQLVGTNRMSKIRGINNYSISILTLAYLCAIMHLNIKGMVLKSPFLLCLSIYTICNAPFEAKN